MDKLSDLELCKKIAEIEGVSLNEGGALDGMMLIDGSWTYYNPLTDKAMLWDLMFKYHVDICHWEGGDYMISVDDYATGERLASIDDVPSEGLNRAMLEVIVEANNG